MHWKLWKDILLWEKQRKRWSFPLTRTRLTIMRRTRKPATSGRCGCSFFISKERVSEKDSEIVDVYTQGLGYLGKAPDAVHLRPRDGGIMMPEGRDVFIQACTYMPKNVLYLLEKNGYTLDNLTYFIGHQAICVSCPISPNSSICRKRSSCIILKNWEIPVR